MAYLRDFVSSQLQKHAERVEYRQVGDSDVFLFCCAGESTSMNCCVRAKERTRNICITVSSGIRAPRARMPQAYELVCRLNTGMVIGQYWVDSIDGEISFSITANLLGMRANDRWFGSLIYTAFATFDKFLPVVSTVLFGKKSPAKAIAAQEGPTDEEITQRLKRLLATTGPESPGTTTDCGDSRGEGDSARDSRQKRAAKPRIDAKITERDVDGILREHRKRTRRSERDDNQ